MKVFFYVIVLLLTITSCKQPTEEIVIETVEKDEINPITDPNQFIGKHKTKTMVLGVFHFQNSKSDSYKTKFPFDILESKRQKELETLLNKIVTYKPTKILLESNRIKGDSIINLRYRNFLKDSFDIRNKPNEIFQIGFKLAQKLNHSRVFCADASADWFGVELDWDNYDEDAYLKSKGQYEKSVRYNYDLLSELHDSLKTVQTLTEHLVLINNPQNRLKDHQRYLTSALEGAGDNYLGADNTARQYRRNLRIFANAYDITNFDDEERLLLVYGYGHVWQLRQLFMDSPDFDYVEANDYLTE
jgi:hypothetical protein